MSEQTTPGYTWHEGTPCYQDASQLGFATNRTQRHDLRDMYPLPKVEVMQAIWDGRNVSSIESENGSHITTVELNASAEQGTILWLPGWGVSNLRDGGARVAVAMAAINPEMRILTAEEIERPAPNAVSATRIGNMLPYAKHYAPLVDRVTGPVVASGHSRGAIIQTLLTAHGYVEPVALNVMDSPGYRDVRPAAKFAAQVGVLDNLVQREYMRDVHLVDTTAEAKVGAIDLGNVNTDTPLKALLRAKQQWHLIQAMSRVTMPEVLGKVAKDGDCGIFVWHGTENVGTPVNSVRQTIHQLQDRYPGSVRYFESKTGHYSEGHTARYARKTAFAKDHSIISKN